MRALYQMELNKKTNADFAQLILTAQAKMNELNYQRDRFGIAAENKVKQFASDAPAAKVHDLVAKEQAASKKSKSAKIVERLAKFSPVSTNVSNYNEELRLQLELDGKNFDQQIKYVLKSMSENNVKPDT